jgi:hypothetical protein
MTNKSLALIAIFVPVLGAFMFYYGLLASYVTLSIAGAVLVIISILYAFTPRAALPGEDALKTFVKETIDAAALTPMLTKYDYRARFTPAGKLILERLQEASYSGPANGFHQGLTVDVPTERIKQLVPFDTKKAGKGYKLTKRYGNFLQDKQLISEFKISSDGAKVDITVGNPLAALPEMNGKSGHPANIALSPMLSTFCAFASADLNKELTLTKLENLGDATRLELEIKE